MKTLLILITITQLCQASYKAGQCDQWCKDFPDFYYDGGEWSEKEKRCRCYHDYDNQFMGSFMRIPITIKKTPPENSGYL